MPTIQEGSLRFSFPSNFATTGYDRSHHYRDVRQKLDESAVDIVAFRHRNRPPDLWLLEVKDFRDLRGEPGAKNDRAKLPDNTVRKAADTLIGLRDAAVNAARPREREFAAKAIKRTRNRVALHLEPFKGRSKLFPEQPSPSHVFQKMKQLLQTHPELDPNPLVLSMRTIERARKYERIPWSVSVADVS